jgi:hypothetical protein
MTDDEAIEFERLKTARDSLLLKVANLRGQLETIAADERKACAELCIELAPSTKTMTAYKVLHEASKAILARGQA